MSTEIHGGLRLTPGTNPFAVIRAARALIEPLREQRIAEAVAEEAGRLVHTAEISGQPVLRPLRAAADKLVEETMESDWRQLNCRIGMADDPETGIIHLLVLGADEYREAVLEIDGVEEYAYWSGMNPERISPDEWVERRDVWDRIFPGIGSVSRNMMVAAIDDRYAFFKQGRVDEFRAVEAHLPNEDDRVLTLIADRVFARMQEADPISIDRFMSTYPKRMGRAKEFAQSGAFDAVRKLVGSLIGPTSWETFGEGATTSLFHANRDRVDWLIARSIHVDLV